MKLLEANYGLPHVAIPPVYSKRFVSLYNLLFQLFIYFVCKVSNYQWPIADKQKKEI